MLSPSENAALDQVTLQHDERSENKPRLLVEDCNPDRTVSALRDIVAKVGGLYDRGVPVRLAFDQMQRGIVAQVMSPDAFVLMAHAVCRPYLIKTKKDGTHEEVDARLPRSLAVMYLDWRGKWDLPVLNGIASVPLNGIASVPLLQDDGGIKSGDGYDSASGMWCENVPDLAELVPEQPTKDDARAALALIRDAFKTFCFADAVTVYDADCGVPVVDVSELTGP